MEFVTDLHRSLQCQIHGNPSSGSRADTRGQTDKRTETWTYMKLSNAFWDYENALDNTWVERSNYYVDINQLDALNYALLYFSFTMAPTCFGKTMPSSGSDYVPF
jgi:hypothetical protein